jgi:hypothetical protein
MNEKIKLDPIENETTPIHSVIDGDEDNQSAFEEYAETIKNKRKKFIIATVQGFIE